jgi:hypothetical protein
MSRIDDSDNQRIREMQEADHRQRIDREKRDAETRVSRSFNEVMSQRNRGELNKQSSQNKKESESQQSEQKSVLDQIRQQEAKKKEPAELARKAALSRHAQAGMLKNRAVEGQEQRVMNEQRTEELVAKGEEDRERVDRTSAREDDKEAARTEEKQAEHRVKQDHPDRVDPDGRNEKRQQHQGREQEKEKDGVAAVEGPRAAHAPRIPPDLIEKIVSRLFQAINPDGRTSLQMDLKGEGLEGVTLKLAAENGRVSCTFEGCSAELRTALKNGKGALQRGLAKRGMKLVALRVS